MRAFTILLRSLSASLVFGAAVSMQLTASAAEETLQRSVAVRVDPRVELVCVVFRLAGNPEYGRGRIKTYLDDVEKHFDAVRSHELIDYAAGLRSKYGVSYDACMSMAVHIEPKAPWRLRFPAQPRPEGLDGRWRDQSPEEFLTRLNEFTDEGKFDAFLEQHQDLYKTTEQRLTSLLESEVHLEWFDDFFGARPAARFTVIPALVNGGSCYGPHVTTPEGQLEYYCILGVWKTDWHGQPQFDKSVVGTIIHEFCHSYTNAIVDRHAEEFREAGEALFAHVEDSMRRQAYGTWKTMIYESLVRASVIRYLHRFESPGSVRREIGRQNQRGFGWIEGLSNLLGEYEENRDKYATLDDFAPRLVEFFDDYAEELAVPPPQVVAMTPTNGDEQVDPSLTEIRVEFDRPMRDDQWSMCGAGEAYPEVVGQPSYDKTCKIWTVHVRLKPQHEYQFSLNSRWFRSFQSADGKALEPVPVRFKTGPDKGESTAPQE